MSVALHSAKGSFLGGRGASLPVLSRAPTSRSPRGVAVRAGKFDDELVNTAVSDKCDVTQKLK
jgi:hypothetical protein